MARDGCRQDNDAYSKKRREERREELLLTVQHIRLSLGSPVEDERRRGGEGGSNSRQQLCSDRSERKTAATKRLR
ncbi:unnamed protein product [Sphagnum jensenii]|uniref:BHLH transcription factor n=1 Tax=Sphagnum jensenii TaxID=128206 RepID=A0ABP0WWH7_9BRYO